MPLPHSAAERAEHLLLAVRKGGSYNELVHALGHITEAQLAHDVAFDPVANTVQITALFNWYTGDFGGRSGVLRFLKRYDAIAMDAAPRIRYSPYDRSVSTGNYSIR